MLMAVPSLVTDNAHAIAHEIAGPMRVTERAKFYRCALERSAIAEFGREGTLRGTAKELGIPYTLAGGRMVGEHGYRLIWSGGANMGEPGLQPGNVLLVYGLI